MDGPICVIRLLFRGLQLCPVIDEIDKCLGLHHLPRHVFQTVWPKLYGPLGNPTCCFTVLDDITQRGRADHCDGMPLEILLQLPACLENSIYQLLPMRISLFRLNKHFADIINRVLFARLLPLHHYSYTDRTTISSDI